MVFRASIYFCEADEGTGALQCLAYSGPGCAEERFTTEGLHTLNTCSTRILTYIDINKHKYTYKHKHQYAYTDTNTHTYRHCTLHTLYNLRPSHSALNSRHFLTVSPSFEKEKQIEIKKGEKHKQLRNGGAQCSSA